MIEAQNIVAQSPQILDMIAREETSIEASPIYTTLDLELSIVGSYETTSYIHNYNYTSSIPQRTRERILTSPLFIESMVTGDSEWLDFLSADFANGLLPSTDKFHAILRPGVYYQNEYSEIISSHFSPLYQAVTFRGRWSETGAVIGTKIKKSDLSETDITDNLFMDGPSFALYSTDEGRIVVDEWVFPSSDADQTIETATFTDSDWRDLRGTYINTYEWEGINGAVTSTAKWIIG